MDVLVVEDEQVAAKKIIKLLNDVAPHMRVVGQTASVKESVKWLMKNKPDLIFMDIQLSDGTCFNIFEQLQVDAPVVFTTAYDQYAIKAFEINSLAYLLKPVRKSAMVNALAKYERFYRTQTLDMNQLLAQVQGTTSTCRERFLVQIGEKIMHITTSDIAWFHVIEKDVYAVTKANKTYPLDFSLDAIMDEIDQCKFFRINRRYIINIDAIDSMVAYSRGRVKVHLNPPASVPEEVVVSVERASSFKKWLNR
ncbi:MAG: LytTR family DNA-binding domain-containing protein [Salinivirgaceae bacterium]|jgi:two-component system response regulator LytT|nr:LytTR family DNA-binding domain-containing protein [Salinivirgaceae bacterium]